MKNKEMCKNSISGAQIVALPLILAGCMMLSGCGSVTGKQEAWNSYYYGGYQAVNGKFVYEDNSDNDSHYVPPTRGGLRNTSPTDYRDDSMFDGRNNMRNIELR